MWIWVLTGIVVLGWSVDFVLFALNLRHSRSAPKHPDFLEEWSDAKKERALEYLKARGSFSLVQSGFFSLLILVVLHSGIYLTVEQWVGVESPVWTSVFFLGFFFLSHWVMQIPFDAYYTFSLEERFGFNRSTGKVFLSDKGKELILTVVLALPLLIAIVFLFYRYPQDAWWMVWAVVTAFQLLMGYLAPVFLLPLFFRMEPIPEGELRDAIFSMAKKMRFPLQGIYTIDGSRRSSKANAFFTGFGKNKKIVLFDTLVAKHSVPELVAVLAHEIGHAKLWHIPLGFGRSILTTGLMLFCFSLLPNFLPPYQELGLSISFHSTALLAMFFLPVFFFWMQFLQNAISRSNEFAADRFAVKAVGDSKDLISALKKLSTDQFSNLYPHPLVVWLEYSHPPLVERVKAMRSV